MSGSTSEQSSWLKTVLGFDLDAALSGAASPRPSAAKGFFDRFSSKKQAKTEPQPTPEPKPADTADKELTDKLKALMDKINALQAQKFDVKQMKTDLVDLTRAAEKAEKVQGDKRQAGIDQVKQRIDDMIEHVDALSTSMAGIMGASKGEPTADQRNQAYEKTLKDYYGLEIEVPPGMTNTHFDQVFDMFGTVPKSHTKQDKLKKLKYSNDDIGGVFYYGDCKIEMGNFGDGTRMEDDPSSSYELDGKKVPANSFNVTTLHEIGHSVDYKHTIMGDNQGKAGCGNWIQESLDSVTTALFTELKASAGLSDKATDAVVKTAVQTALDAGTVTQPDTIEDADWHKILPFLQSHCLPVRDAAQPYFTNATTPVGGRVFTESSKGYWWSYSSNARGATRVNNYQWRSPPEWFAEVYAITWLAKKPPPSGVDQAAAQYCWNG